MNVCVYIYGHPPYDPPTFVLTVNLQHFPVFLLYPNPTPILWILHILIWAHFNRILVSSKASANPMIQPKHRPAAPTTKEAQRPKTKKPILGEELLVFFGLSKVCSYSLVKTKKLSSQDGFFGFWSSGGGGFMKYRSLYIGIYSE